MTIGSRLGRSRYPSNYFDAIAFHITPFPEVKRRIFHQKLSAIPKKKRRYSYFRNALVKKALLIIRKIIECWGGPKLEFNLLFARAKRRILKL